MSYGSVMKKKSFSVETGKLEQQSSSTDSLRDVEPKLQKGTDKIVQEHEFKHTKDQNGEKSSFSKKSATPKELHRKEFILRNSTFTNLWKNADVSSLYNACFAFYFLLYIYIAAFYYFNTRRLKRDLAVVYWTFSKFHIVTAIWLATNLSIVFLSYPTFRFWATSRTFVKRKGLYDAMFCTLFIFYQAALFIIPPVAVIAYDLPMVSSFIVIVEKVRLFMKNYAFVRENATRALKYKPHQDGDKEDSDSHPCPKVRNLLYFLFAPTLVYRDNYPRTSHIRWSNVAWNVIQWICVIVCSYISHICFSVGTLSRAGVEPIPVLHFISILGVSIFTGSLVMFTAFYSTLHCWQNCFAELLRFGDRMFYDDWWNCTSYAQYYRSWNVIVHDWLYSYVYRDMYFVLGRSRIGAMLSVFLLSAVVHEYVLAVTFKFVFPLLFILFSTFGVILVFITRKSTSSFWNFFLWCSLFQGYGLLTVFYAVEWYARINCPRILDSWLDYVVPRSFQCNIISFSSEANNFNWYPSDY